MIVYIKVFNMMDEHFHSVLANFPILKCVISCENVQWQSIILIEIIPVLFQLFSYTLTARSHLEYNANHQNVDCFWVKKINSVVVKWINFRWYGSQYGKWFSTVSFSLLNFLFLRSVWMETLLIIATCKQLVRKTYGCTMCRRFFC